MQMKHEIAFKTTFWWKIDFVNKGGKNFFMLLRIWKGVVCENCENALFFPLHCSIWSVVHVNVLVIGFFRISNSDVTVCWKICRETSPFNEFTHYSKSQIFVQKFNFDKIGTFSRVFHPKFFWHFFSWNQSCEQLKSPKPHYFHEFFNPQNYLIWLYGI